MIVRPFFAAALAAAALPSLTIAVASAQSSPSPAPSAMASAMASPMASPMASMMPSPMASMMASPMASAMPSPMKSPMVSPMSSAMASPMASPMASGAPAPSPSGSAAASPAPSPTPYKLITLAAYGDGGFTSVNGTDAARFINTVPSRVFDASTGAFFDLNGGRQLAPANDFNNSLDLQNANVQLTLNGPVVSAKFEGSFGTDADVIASNGQSRSGVNLTQAYLQFVGGPLTFLAGKFSSLAGAEVIEAPNNSNYSRSYLFGYAVPFTHTGVRATYAYNSKFSIVAGVNNGWDDWKFAGKKKTLEGALVITPSPAVALTLDTYNGSDFNFTRPSEFSNRMLYDGVLTVHPTGAMTIVANYDNGTQLPDNDGLFSFVYGGAAHWNGIAGYLNYQFTPQYALSLRKETFHDVQGYRTGLIQRLQSNTATINWTPGANYLFRAEYRFDTSDNNYFTFRNALPGEGRPHQSSIGIETIFKFQ